MDNFIKGENDIKIEKRESYKIIYVLGTNINIHEGLLKIGETTVSITEDQKVSLYDNSDLLVKAAKDRVDQYLGTAGISYEVLYTTIAKDNQKQTFSDKKVHKVLEHSNFQKENLNNKATEWFRCDLETAKNAIKAVKEGRKSLTANEISKDKTPIILRKEQEDGISLAKNNFTKRGIEKEEKDFILWDCKMRFGKTLTALQLVKEMNFEKTIIVTHKPVVNNSWFEEFNKIFYEESDSYKYCSKTKGESLSNIKPGDKFVYFASLQDLRGSLEVGGKYDKNDDIFSIGWDFLIVDEAHEGTQTDLGDVVINKLANSTNKTKTLFLSGTPYNLLNKNITYNGKAFAEDNVYSWTYVDEQEAKLEWFKNYPTENNPYADLPRLNIFAYDLNKDLNKKYFDSDEAFSFKEFFRIKTKNSKEVYQAQIPNFDDIEDGSFIHEKDILKFLDLLTTQTNYPYTREYNNIFRHTLWMLPGVKEAKALSRLLKAHRYFSTYEIVNVAGDGDEEERFDDALDKVSKAIGDDPDETKTITLSCGRLTTGVTVKPWNGVFMLSGSKNTSAIGYLQTIFRVQSPFSFNGKVKQECYVFDFAPDRVLKVITDAVTSSYKNRSSLQDKKIIEKFINFCPIISVEGSQMKKHNVDTMMTTIKKIIINKVVEKGFDCPELYSKEKINSLTQGEINFISDVDKIIKASKQKTITEYTINDEGFDEVKNNVEQGEKTHRVLDKKEKDKRKEEAKKALLTLRGVAIRCPLLIYGIDKDINDEISIDNFTSFIDDKSWIEFMPKGFTKEMFDRIKDFFDPTVFIKAGLKIRKEAKECDSEPTAERIVAINELISKFKNPDKETVLTPWRVVNTHMEETLGGASFYDEEFENLIRLDDNTSTRWISKDFTNEVFNDNSKILEINSKTGLYPLYCAYSIYQNNVDNGYKKDISTLWKDIIENNIFIICRTKMAMQITKRTLVGYREDIKPNIIVIDDISERMSKEYSQNYQDLIEYITNNKTWNIKGEDNMKFTAVVGNPPYQSKSKLQIYADFYLLSRELGSIVSLIFPTGWQEPKDKNNLQKLNNEAIKQDKQIVFIDNRQNLFEGISGAEWTNFILWEKGYNNGLNCKQRILINGLYSKEEMLIINPTEVFKPDEIKELEKLVKVTNFKPMQDITSTLKPYGLRTDIFENNVKYGLPSLSDVKKNDTDIKIFGSYKRNRTVKYVPSNYPLPKKSRAFGKYKVFVPYAWGGMDEKKYLGGTYSDIIVAKPYEIATETYQEQGCYDTIDRAIAHAKYIMTRFARACLYIEKKTQHSTNAWGSVPQQDFSEDWWNESIDVIEENLFDKYHIPKNIRDFIVNNIQFRCEENILEV